jgi:digeranylgeranylglycerophospholipid reductase
VPERVDVLVVGAGPAGSTAARLAAQAGARVLLVERKSCIGRPVQCAEYVPAQIVQYAPLPKRCIAQRIETMSTHLPDGERVETPAAGYVIDRALFDKALAVRAHQAGAQVWTGARAIERTAHGALIRQGGRTVEVEASVLVGADGPRSTVGRWVGHENTAYIDARQVEVVLPSPRASTEIYFHPLYRGGYGWLFPKGDTANVGVGASREMGGDVGQLRAGNVLLVGDAAGHTHPITGAGVASAVIGGTLAGQAVARAALDEYEREWASFMRGPLRHALAKKRHLDQDWSDDPGQLGRLLRETWVAFRAYGRRVGRERTGRGSLKAD